MSMKRVVINESQLKNLIKNISEDLDYNHVSDATKDEYDMDEGKRSLSRTRKKRLFSKAEIMANPDRFKKFDKDLKGIK